MKSSSVGFLCISYFSSVCRNYRIIQGKRRVSERHCEDCRNENLQQGCPQDRRITRSKYKGRESEEEKGDEQFEIDDSRSLDVMYRDIAEEGLQPVLNDYVYV